MRDSIINIVKEAGKIVQGSFYKGCTVSEKSPKDLVTNTDIVVENYIRRNILKLYPDVSIYGEETGLTKGNSTWEFVIDPIDGTSNFIFGVPHLSISLAEIINHQVILAIVYNPLTGDLFYADHESQPTLNGKRISVSSRKDVKEGFIILGMSGHAGSMRKYLKEWDDAFHHSKKTLALLSPSLNICSVASGNADAFIDYGCSYEGQVAASYILQRAGGEVLNYDGSPYRYRDPGIIATNGSIKLHRK